MCQPSCTDNWAQQDENKAGRIQQALGVGGGRGGAGRKAGLWAAQGEGGETGSVTWARSCLLSVAPLALIWAAQVAPFRPKPGGWGMYSPCLGLLCSQSPLQTGYGTGRLACLFEPAVRIVLWVTSDLPQFLSNMYLTGVL